jgi:drug/metabolite transporter (DMT)-like permease
MAVLVPLIFKVVRNEPIKKGHVVAFVVAIVGASLALRVWNTDDLRIDGLMYSLAALVANGMFIEVSSRSSGDAQNLHTKVFWQSVGLVIIGMFLGGAAPIQMSSHQWALLAGVALLSGLVNFYLFFIAVKHIGGVLAGMLALSITPLTIIVSYIFLGKTMGLDQIVGVAIGLSAVGYIARTGSR